MKCPQCGSEMTKSPDVYALGKALNVSRANIPAAEDKITLKAVMYVDVDVCPNQDCRHVALSALPTGRS